MRRHVVRNALVVVFAAPAFAAVVALAAPVFEALGLRGASKPLYVLLSYICPQIPSHSLWLFGAPTGISSRSLFLYLGFVLAGTCFVKRGVALRWWLGVLLLLPTVLDALMHGRASDNVFRVLTGALAGVGVAGLAVSAWRKLARVDGALDLRGLVILNRTVVVVMLLAFLPSLLPAPRVAAQERLTIPEGTRLAVKLPETVSSETATQGQVVRFEVVRDVEVKGKVVIKAGAPATGEVTRVVSKRMVGREGELLLTIRAATAVDGTQVPLRATLEQKGEGRLETTVVLGVVLCPLFLLMKGEEAVIPAGTEYSVFVDRPVDVTA